MISDPPLKNESNASPNKEAEILITECAKLLSDYLPPYGIDGNDKSILHALNDKNEKAKIIIHKDNRGATIISSSGSITKVGDRFSYHSNESEETNYYEKKLETNNQLMYSLQEAITLLKSGLTIDKAEEIKLKRLDEILPNVVLLVSDDKQNVIIADDQGNAISIGNSTLVINGNVKNIGRKF